MLSINQEAHERLTDTLLGSESYILGTQTVEYLLSAIDGARAQCGIIVILLPHKYCQFVNYA